MKDAAHKAKMRNRYTGPYVITDISLSGLYFLRDKYSHRLKRLVPPNQLVWYYGVGGFCKAKVEAHDEVFSDNSSDVDMNSSLHQTKSNVGVCDDLSSDSLSDVDINSSNIPKSSDSSSDTDVAKSAFQNCMIPVPVIVLYLCHTLVSIVPSFTSRV